MSCAVTRDKHGVPDGKLVAYKKLHLIKIFNFLSLIYENPGISVWFYLTRSFGLLARAANPSETK